MANKKDKSRESSKSRPGNAVKKNPSTKNKISKNIYQFEKLISGFSAALISTPEEGLEKELNSWLKKFAEFLKVDRCIVNEFLEDGKTVHCLLNYTVPEIDIEPVMDTYQPPQGVIREFKKGILVKAEKIPEDLPESFRGGIIEKTNTKSIIIAPLTVDKKVIGSLLFASHRKKRKWSDDLIRRIKLIGEIIANAIIRIHSHKSLNQEMERREALEKRYSVILKNSNVGFLISDLDQNILEVNDEYCRMSGYSRDELLKKKIWEIDASVDSGKVEKEAEGLHEIRVRRLITSHLRKDGGLFDVEVSGNYFEEEGIVCTFIRDITELNKTKVQLEERLKFEELISDFSAALININPEDIYVVINNWLKEFVEFLKAGRGVVTEYFVDQDAARVLMQYTVPGIDAAPLDSSFQIKKKTMEEFRKGILIKAEKIPEDLPPTFPRDFKARSIIIVPLFSGNKAFGNLAFADYESERKWSDDLVRRIKLVGEIIANAILRVRSHENLIKETEQRKKLEDRYSSIIRNANIGFWISDKEQNILVVNDEYCRMSGYSREEILSMKIPDIDISFGSGEGDITEEILGIGASHHEVTHIRRDGTLMDLDVSSSLLKRENLLFSFMRDITELNKTKREQAERLRFEELASEFSAALINIAPENMYYELNKWLKKFVEFLQVDRGIVNEHLYDEDMIHLLLNYSIPGIDVDLTEYHRIPGGIREDFIRGLSVIAEKIPDDLPEGLRGGIVEKENAKSIIIVPIKAGNEVIGNLTFLNYRNERKWSDELVSRIKLIGEIIANAILRKRSHEVLFAEMERRQVLEERYTSFIKNADLGFMVSDMNSIILDVNDAYCEMSGYSRDELIGMGVEKIDESLSAKNELTPEKKELLKKTGLFIETAHRRKDGTFFDVALSSNFLEKEDLIFNFIRDITEANKAKREQEERLKFEELVSGFSTALINIQPDDIADELGKWLEKFVGLIDADRAGINEYQDNHKTIKNLIQYSVPGINIPIPDIRKTPEGEITELKKGIIVAEKIPEDLHPMFSGSYIEKSNAKSLIIVPLLTGNRIFGNLAFTNYRNERRWSEELIRRIRLIAEIVGNAVLRLRSHEALLEEMERRHMLEDRYSSIIKSANVGFMISDMDARILEVNDAYCEMSGYSRAELLNMKIYQLDISGNPEKVDNDKSGIFKTGAFHHETGHIRKDGKVVDVLISANLLQKEGLVCGFIRDVTELKIARKDLEDRLKFEELTAEFSAALINIDLDDINIELNLWLKKFVEFLEVDRGIAYEYIDDGKTIKSLMNYTNPDIEIDPPEEIMQVPPKVMDEFKNGVVVRSERIPDDLPVYLRGWVIEEHNTKSLVIVPLTAGNQILGNLTFACYRIERKWSDELVRRIKLIGEIIANAISRKRSSDALIEEMKRRQHLQERYSSIIKTANVGFWISDMDQNILVVNDEYCRMSGYSRDELLKMKIADIDSSKNYGEVDKIGADSVERGSSHRERTHIRKDGAFFDVEISTNFLAGEQLFFCFTRDISELNKAKIELEARLKFEELVSEFSAALINVKLDDAKQEINLWLERFASILNVERCTVSEYQDNYTQVNLLYSYTNADTVNRFRAISPKHSGTFGFHKYLVRDDIIKYESLNGSFPDDLSYGLNEMKKDGTKSILLLPVKAGDLLLGTMSVSTLTFEKKWEEEQIRRLKLIAEIFANALMRDKADLELERYRKHLEIMVDERTAELKDAQKELVISEKMATLGRLTATVSHELRNPLGTIRSSVYSVHRRLKGQDEKVATALDRVERNIRRCDLIIDELLDYSRSRDLKLEPTPIDRWLSEVIEETGIPEGISINKELNANTVIDMDTERFRQSMVNILNNAYQSIQEKGADEPGIVTMTTHRNAGNLIVEISDNGVGFDMEHKSKIFEPLYSTKTFGVGLGVPITRQIIEQHGWHMDITGEPQKGATVIITIPL